MLSSDVLNVVAVVPPTSCSYANLLGVKGKTTGGTAFLARRKVADVGFVIAAEGVTSLSQAVEQQEARLLVVEHERPWREPNQMYAKLRPIVAASLTCPNKAAFLVTSGQGGFGPHNGDPRYIRQNWARALGFFLSEHLCEVSANAQLDVHRNLLIDLHGNNHEVAVLLKAQIESARRRCGVTSVYDWWPSQGVESNRRAQATVYNAGNHDVSLRSMLQASSPLTWSIEGLQPTSISPRSALPSCP